MQKITKIEPIEKTNELPLTKSSLNVFSVGVVMNIVGIIASEHLNAGVVDCGLDNAKVIAALFQFCGLAIAIIGSGIIASEITEKFLKMKFNKKNNKDLQE